jgi:hypothetical protein
VYATRINTKLGIMTTTKSKQVKQIEDRISRIKRDLEHLGPMRPGSISRQYRHPQERKTPFYQISYTHRMKSRTEYLRNENLKAVRSEVANFKRFRKLVDQWADAALKTLPTQDKPRTPFRPILSRRTPHS